MFHQGACSDTTESDGRYMMENNYRYSAALLEYCQREEVPLIYASSAAVYGAGPDFTRGARVTRRRSTSTATRSSCSTSSCGAGGDERTAQVVGLRYFNVYGAREQHKGRMASVAFHFFNQYRDRGKVKLFEGSGGYGDGEQRRDFVSVEDVVAVNLHFLEHPNRSGHLQRRHRRRAELQRRCGGDRECLPRARRVRRRSRWNRCSERV